MSPHRIPPRIPTLAWALLIAIATAGLPTHAPAAPPPAPRCDICKTRITGRYYTVNGQNVCAKCYARYPKCPGCGAPVRSSAHDYNGKRVCSDCAKRAGLCANCGDVLLGRFYESTTGNSARFCETCVKTKPKCAVCGLPYPDMKKINGDWVCTNCQAKAPKCSACGAPLAGKYYRIPYQTGQFCRACFEERPHCDFCGRPVLRDGKHLADGRLTCALCAADSIQDTDDALDLLAAAVRYLEVHHGMVVRHPYDFILVNNAEMSRVMGRPENSPMQELGLFSSKIAPWSPRPAILILTELPRRAFLEVIAHEYAHMWTFENNPNISDMEVVEGFAQWIASKWLEKQQEFSSLARLEARSDPFYGTGYRQLAQLEKNQGHDSVIRYTLQSGNPAAKIDWPQKLYAAPGDMRNPRPLPEILPHALFTGNYAFLTRAVPVAPELIRQRPPRDVREARQQALEAAPKTLPK